MIVHMTRVRIFGPNARLPDVLAFAQNEGALHLVEPTAASVTAIPTRLQRYARHLRRTLEDVEAALSMLGAPAPVAARLVMPAVAAEARFARRARRDATHCARELAGLDDGRAVLLRYRDFFEAFAPLWGHELAWPGGHAFYVVMRAGAEAQVRELRRELTRLVGDELELLARPLRSKEQAVLILVPADAAQTVARLLSDSRVQELPAPPAVGGKNLLRSMSALETRLRELPERRAAVELELRRLARAYGPRLTALRAWLHDQLLVTEAREKVHSGSHAFVLEGYLPSESASPFEKRAAQALGAEVVVEVSSEEAWSGEGAPVVLKNPPLFRPFEVLTRRLPLPRYGSIDPTPFVALFFPAFFGLMLGDLGYGALLALLAAVLHLKSHPDTMLRSVARVMGACAAFTLVFGALFGELFGTLGRPLGLHPLWFDREQAIVPFLMLAVALGVVHVALGLVLAAVSAWRRGHKREAMGRGVATSMLLLTVAALLAAFELLPRALMTPLVVAVLIAFPLLVALEGVVAVIELMSTFGHVLSYARIMALGTASLMLAVVANQMVGALGSVAVGAVFALLFHLVNFAIGLFSPTLHALRLHYVEFFGKFFSPGGAEYRPLAHWHPEHGT